MAEKLTSTPDPKDVQDNKIFAVLAYFGILFLVPLLAAKESPFARYHANQGIILFIVSIAGSIVLMVLAFIFALVSLGFLSTIIMGVYSLGMLGLIILGIINAVNGEMKELPLIGKFQILK